MTAVLHPGDALSGRQRLVYILVLGALTALGPFTVDLYLPSLPNVQGDFGVSTSLVQLTLSATTIGFALRQLIVGPWSGVVAVATVRDLFGGYPLVRMLSRLALVSGLAPVIAPLAGSALLLAFPWRGIFWVLAAYGLLVVAASIVFIVETLPAHRRREPGSTTGGQRYRALFRDRQFVGIAIVSGMVFSGLFAYLTTSPFLFQNHYHFTAQQYGLLFAVNSVGIIVGVQTSSRIARHVGPQWILAFATAALLLTAVLIVIDGFVGGVLIPLWFFTTSCAFCFPCVQAVALAHHGAEAGTAASVLGAANFGIAGLISPLIGIFSVASSIPMGVMMIGTSVIGILALWLIVRPTTVAALDH